ncbi:MAG: hypothetical protein LC772_05610, partial [Chloroflexi bacterium]|nr:hypothetical protein [Chloroflexota bacterium]
PTRLLDWSTSALVGLFFAVENRPQEPGAVFAFEPTLHVLVLDTERSERQTAPLSARSELPRIIIEFAMGERQARPQIRNQLRDEGQTAAIKRSSAVVPILPDLHAGRMLQQGACFTLHIPSDDAANIDARSVVRYEVPAEAKKAVLRQLRELGVTSSSVFPDLDHVARDVCTEFVWRAVTGLRLL